MEKEEFERIVQEEFDSLPERFRTTIDNVRIIVEEGEAPAVALSRGTRARSMLLGLYQGIPLNRRGSWYGMTPVVPDTITLYRRNIESLALSDVELRERIREVLIHEIGHYFGLSEREIREAGY